MKLKGKEVPDIVGLKSLGRDWTYSGVSPKSLNKAFRKGRKQTCITYYVASKNFTFVKLNLYNCLMTDEEIRQNNLLKVI